MKYVLLKTDGTVEEKEWKGIEEIIVPDAGKVAIMRMQYYDSFEDTKTLGLYLMREVPINEDERGHGLFTLAKKHGQNKLGTYINKEHDIFGTCCVFSYDKDVSLEVFTGIIKVRAKRDGMKEYLMFHYSGGSGVRTRRERMRVYEEYLKFLRKGFVMTEEHINIFKGDIHSKYVAQGKPYIAPLMNYALDMENLTMLVLDNGLISLPPEQMNAAIDEARVDDKDFGQVKIVAGEGSGVPIQNAVVGEKKPAPTP